jgi:hypothetical protein
VFALLGTTIACISTGYDDTCFSFTIIDLLRIMVYGSIHAFSSLNYFSFTDSLYFGAMISATDPGWIDKSLVFMFFSLDF